MGAPQLQIYLFGQFSVYRDGKLITDEAWRTSKNKTVLKVLLTEPGQIFPTDTLLENVWPESDPESSLPNLRGRISELRRILEPDIEKAADSAFITTATGGYRFDPSNAFIDTERFQTLLSQGRQQENSGELDEAIDLYEEAAELYQGDFLPEDNHQDWAVACRHELRSKYLELLDRLMAGLMQLDRFQKALPYGHEAIRLDPYRESFHRQLMTCHFELHHYAEALQIYLQLEEKLKNEFLAEPSEETQQLYERIRQEADAQSGTRELEERLEQLECSEAPEALLARIDTLHSLREWDQERELIEHALAQGPDQWLKGWLYLKLAEHYQGRSSFQKSLDCAQEGLELLKHLDEKGHAQALAMLSTCHYSLSQMEETIEHASQALQLFKKLGEVAGQTRMLSNLAISHVRLGHFEKARSYLDECYRLDARHGNLTGQVNDIYNFGFLAFRQGYLGQARLFFQKARDLAHSIAFKRLELQSMESLAPVMRREGHVGEAIRINKELAKRQQDDPEALNFTYTNLGITYECVGQYEEALNWYQRALEVQPEDDPLGTVYSLANLGLCQTHLEQYDEALRLLNQADELLSQMDDPWWQVQIKQFIGETLIAQDNHEKAIDELTEAVDQAKRLGNQDQEIEALSLLIQASVEAGRTDGLEDAVAQLESLLESGSGDEKAFNYWALHLGLKALGEHSRANEYLELAYREVMTEYELIDDPVLQDSFLNNVKLHRKIVNTYSEA